MWQGMGVTVLTAAGKVALDAIIRKEQTRKVTLLADLKNAFDHTAKILKKCDVERITVLQAKRSLMYNRVANNANKWAVYAIFQSKLEEGEEQLLDYEGVAPDDHYVSIIEEVNSKYPIVLTKDEISEHTLIGGIYRSLGVTYSEIHLIKRTRGNVFYISYASSKAFEFAETDEAIRLNIEKFKIALKSF